MFSGLGTERTPYAVGYVERNVSQGILTARNAAKADNDKRIKNANAAIERNIVLVVLWRNAFV
ncbi:MAG TPA: hypothetical protein DIU00_24310 [Phycisphaerales bacterium]|nr:hypothetical protein [Phycisphaerales bacterium]